MRARIEGTLAALRDEWNETAARLSAIEQAIMAVQVVLQATPEDDSAWARGHSVAELAAAGKAVATGSASLTATSAMSAAGDAVASGNAALSGPQGSRPASGEAGRRPTLRTSVLDLLKERPGTWPVAELAEAMLTRGLVGGTPKTARETIRQVANKMAAAGQIRRDGSDYSWPAFYAAAIPGYRSDVLDQLSAGDYPAVNPGAHHHGS